MIRDQINLESSVQGVVDHRRSTIVRKVYLFYPCMETADFMVGPTREFQFERKPPLGLLYLAASLKQHGIDSEIFDESIEGLPLNILTRKINDEEPLLIGIYSDTALKPKVFRLIQELKQSCPSTKLLVGGPGCVEYQEFHDAGCDIVCHGEGEITICEVADYCLNKKNISDIAGISYVDNGETIKNPVRGFIDNLDIIPFPLREIIKVDKYYDYHFFGMRVPYTTMITSRGCAYSCTFCHSQVFWGKQYRLRSAVNVVDEIEELVEQYNIRYIGFKDDIFGFNTEWVYEFVNEMKKRNLKVSFSCMIHPFSFKNKRRKILTLLKEVGLDIIVPGLQSVDEDVLKSVKRYPNEPRYLAELIQEAKRLSISTVLEFILGLPGDTPEVYKKDLDYALKVKPHYALFYSLKRLPGTEISTQYPEGNVTSLSDDQIRKYARNCQRRFFLDPRIVLQDALHVLFKNPGWFWVAGKNIPYLIRASGISK